jgi:hypothetical protein
MRRALRVLSAPVRFAVAFGYGGYVFAEIMWSLAMLTLFPPKERR